MSQLITREQLNKLVEDLLKQGAVVAAPVALNNGRYFFRPLAGSAEMVLTSGLKTANTIKEFFFPRHEVLCTFVREGNDVQVNDVPPFDRQQVIIGSRPCEAASLPILDPLFAWDYQDRFYQSRRENSTVISLACNEPDRHCFCTAVGGSPDNPAGSDVMLYDLGDGTYEVRVLTEKGKALFEGKTSESKTSATKGKGPEITLETEKIGQWIRDHFSDPIWDDMTTRCVGCGACTYVCPTCHCFDIVDEGTYQKGQRVKNWDNCQSALFTLHASGHNPRATQGQRQRQRISHKFAIYPEKFGVLLCTGCGNCTRECSTSLGILPILKKIEELINC